MKNYTLKIAMAFILTLGLTVANAQDKVTDIKKDAPSSKKVVEKVKDQKSDFDEKVDKKGGSFTDAANTVKGKPNQVMKDAEQKKTSVEDELDKIEASYSKRIEMTKDPKAQAKLKEEMHEKMMAIKEKSKNISSEDASTGAVKPKEVPVTKTKPEVTKGKPTVAIKKEKVSSVKDKISARRKSLDNRRAMVKKANEKVAAERAKLDAAKDEGTLTQEEINAKEAKLKDAEAKIQKLEASIEKAEKKFDEKDEKLSSFSDDQKN